MKRVIFLIVVLLVVTILGESVQAGNPKSERDTVAGLTLNLNFQKKDSTSVLTIASFLENIFKNSSFISQFKINIGKGNPSQRVTTQEPVKIVEAYHFSLQKKHDKAFAIGYENYFKIENFKSFKEQILDSLANGEIDLVMFVNGEAFPKTKMSMCDESNRTISFFWSRNDDLTKEFCHFYTSQRFLTAKNLIVGFGYSDPQTHKWKQISSKENIQVVIIQPYAKGLAAIIILLIILTFVLLIYKTNLLYIGKKGETQSSLSSTQMAFWTIIFFFSYLYLWIVNRSLAEIPDSTLVLLGISTVTTAASKGITAIKGKGAGTSDVDNGSKKFYTGLVSEGDASTSIHRVQMLLFTGSFGLYYVIQVFILQTLPELSDNVLWLMGISSGTFVGVRSVMSGPSKTEDADKKATSDAEKLMAELKEAKAKMDEIVDKTADFISKNSTDKTQTSSNP
jgi:hypothetical protein